MGQVAVPRDEGSAVDRRIAEMRRILAAMRQATASESLKVLRERFPDVPLQDRMRALADRPGH